MWFKVEKSKIVIRVFAKPNAKKNTLIGIKEDALHIALNAKPSEGEANKALIHFLAQCFKLPKTQIILVRGEQSRYKQIEIPLSDSILQLLNDLPFKA